jgi:hypothetical protein
MQGLYSSEGCTSILTFPNQTRTPVDEENPKSEYRNSKQRTGNRDSPKTSDVVGQVENGQPEGLGKPKPGAIAPGGWIKHVHKAEDLAQEVVVI